MIPISASLHLLVESRGFSLVQSISVDEWCNYYIFTHVLGVLVGNGNGTVTMLT